MPAVVTAAPATIGWGKIIIAVVGEQGKGSMGLVAASRIVRKILRA